MACSDDAAPAQLASGITRDALERDDIRAVMRRRHPDVPLIDDRTLGASVAATLAGRPPEADAVTGVWVFGYGSLLWNPCVPVTQYAVGRIHGYHRDFRIRLTYGRGTPEAPGLMLGLAPGGSCAGMGLRIAADDLEHELLMIWRREMLTGVYRPRWVRLWRPNGHVPAITFVINTRHPCYRGELDEADKARLLATGHGMIGSSAQYLHNTVEQLDASGIHDRRMHALQARVAKWPAAAPATSAPSP